MNLIPGERLVLATHNAGKLKEFRQLMAPFCVEIVSAGELGLPEPDENGTTFEQNAYTKAFAAAKASGLVACRTIVACVSMRWMVRRGLYRRLGHTAGRQA